MFLLLSLLLKFSEKIKEIFWFSIGAGVCDLRAELSILYGCPVPYKLELNQSSFPASCYKVNNE